MPANDRFADREALAGPLPIEVTRSNVEATKEDGEPFQLFAKGRSIWFEWTATFTGFVTVGTCGSDFPTLIGVYTGTEVDVLTEVAGDSQGQGPGCPANDGDQVTFPVTDGIPYAIRVDGDGFYLPPDEPPAGEGSVALQLDETPVPANDDFGDATVLDGKAFEEPGGKRTFHGSKAGHNWGATKEPGEPDHAGDPGGASVWYVWTPPESGIARINACCAPLRLTGVYAGGAVDALTPIEPAPVPPLGMSYPVAAGVTYRIAVDGRFDPVAGTPKLGSFSVHILMELPPLGGGNFGETPLVSPDDDFASPNTKLRKRRVLLRKRRATFFFEASERNSSFRCKLDRRRWAGCRSPKTYRGLKAGIHVFRVAAVDAAGNVDPTPAISRFSMPGRKHRKR